MSVSVVVVGVDVCLMRVVGLGCGLILSSFIELLGPSRYICQLNLCISYYMYTVHTQTYYMYTHMCHYCVHAGGGERDQWRDG